ncbi:MAG: hypothetical protein EHM12_00690 [Dehalococcoidia bacterium]|nr:MAG: hypothetical protein EHM12_00690 [Dehalococcoidia bacterium]
MAHFAFTTRMAGQIDKTKPTVNNCNVYKGYLSGSIDLWTKGIAEQEEIYKIGRRSEDIYVLILSKYGFISFLIGRKIEYDIMALIISAEADVGVLATDEKFSARATAFKGGLIAMRMNLNPLKAITLGMKSLRLIEESIEADQNNTVGLVEMGNARFHMPSLAGGSHKEAVLCFSQAVNLFETEKDDSRCSWYYLHALVWLARSHESTGNVAEAKRIYEKLLSIEPEFQWVKLELYPEFIKKWGS